MSSITYRTILFLPLLVLNSLHANDVNLKPLSISALQEFGMVYNGVLDDGSREFGRMWVDHLGAFMFQDVEISERFSARAGFGGIFEFPQPERPAEPGGPPSAAWPSLRTKFFFIAPQGHLKYVLGDSESPWLGFKAGLFPYKYNPDAHNLGEYLFRSEAYPNLLTSGGLLMTNSSDAFVRGAVGEFRLGDLRLDMLVLTEVTTPPFYDISLAGVLNYSLGNGVLELGCGANFKRIIPLFNARSKDREHKDNAYVDILGRDRYAGRDYYNEQYKYYDDQANSLRDAGDSAGAAVMQGSAAAWQSALRIITEANNVIEDWQDYRDAGGRPDSNIFSAELGRTDSLRALASGSALDSLNQLAYIYGNVRDYGGYYTASGTIVMVRAAFDIGLLLNMDIIGKNDLKLFAEAAMLGVKDYPVFYEKPAERIPVMLGMNLPGFKVLDRVTFQAEIFRSRTLNSFNKRKDMNNIPGIADGYSAFYSKDAYADITERDDIKWSFLVQKNLGPLSIMAQLARDHLRLPHDAFFFGPGLESGVMTAGESSWYWSLQLGMGI